MAGTREGNGRKKAQEGRRHGHSLYAVSKAKANAESRPIGVSQLQIATATSGKRNNVVDTGTVETNCTWLSRPHNWQPDVLAMRLGRTIAQHLLDAAEDQGSYRYTIAFCLQFQALKESAW